MEATGAIDIPNLKDEHVDIAVKHCSAAASAEDPSTSLRWNGEGNGTQNASPRDTPLMTETFRYSLRFKDPGLEQEWPSCHLALRVARSIVQ